MSKIVLQAFWKSSELLSSVLQLCGSDGHAICCHSDDVDSVEQSVQQPSAQAFGEKLTPPHHFVCLLPACLRVPVTPPARCFAAGLLGCAAGASDSDRRQPAVPEEAGAAWQQVEGALVYRVQPGAASPGCAGGRFLVARLWLSVVFVGLYVCTGAIK